MALKFAYGLALVAFAASSVAAAEKPLQVTPIQALGPYYPVVKPADQDADLTVISGRSGKAQGQILYIVGRVLNSDGKPVQGAEVEIWQADAKGRYNHPSDTAGTPDPDFQGYGVVTTDADGGFRFKTIKPSAYQAGDMKRAPHVHFQVTGKYDRMVTQMYFPGDPLNEKDSLFKEAGSARGALIAKMVPPIKGMEREALMAVWNIVLQKG